MATLPGTMTRPAALRLARHLRAVGYRVAVRRCAPAPGVRYWTVEHWIEIDAHHHRRCRARSGHNSHGR
jgi:hypothetical protein